MSLINGLVAPVECPEVVGELIINDGPVAPAKCLRGCGWSKYIMGQ